MEEVREENDSAGEEDGKRQGKRPKTRKEDI